MPCPGTARPPSSTQCPTPTSPTTLRHSAARSSRTGDRSTARSSASPPALGVLAERVGALPIGIAYPCGLVQHRRGSAKTFRLVVNKVELEGMPGDLAEGADPNHTGRWRSSAAAGGALAPILPEVLRRLNVATGGRPSWCARRSRMPW
jgi:hypothetical protein